MSKRKIDDEESDIDISSTESESSDIEAEEGEIINIDFDFFDVNKEVDFHTIKNLLRQLLGEDSKKVNLSSLTDLILESPTTTIKTDGKESDPYAFLAPLDFKNLKNNDYLKYIHKLDTGLSGYLNKISHKKVALLVGERLINMPIQIVPPLYRMALTESEKANEGESYDYYVIPSRKYEVNDEAEENSNKKIKTVEVDYYHYEDKYFESNSNFKFETDSKAGIIHSFIVITSDNLLKSISSLEDDIAAAFGQ